MAQTTVAINLEAKTKGTESVKSLKAQIREATQEATALAQKFGEFSPQAINAAKRVAQLKDEMQDFQERVQALNPDKFEAIGKLVGGVANGIQAAQGAMALFGSESEDVQKMLLRVQGAMALAQGIQGVINAKNQFKAFGKDVVDFFGKMTAQSKIFITSGIGLLIVALGVVAENWDSIKTAIGLTQKSTEDLEKAQQKYNSELEYTARLVSIYTRDIENQSKIDISNAKKRGATNAEILALETQARNKLIKLAQQEQGTNEQKFRETIQGLDKQSDAYKDALKTYQDTYDKTQSLIDNLNTENIVAQNNLTAQLIEEEKKRQAERVKIIKAANEEALKNIDASNKRERELYNRLEQANTNLSEEQLQRMQLEFKLENERVALVEMIASVQEKASNESRQLTATEIAFKKRLQNELEMFLKVKEAELTKFEAEQSKKRKEQAEELNKQRLENFKQNQSEEYNQAVQNTDQFFLLERKKLIDRNATADELEQLEIARLQNQLLNAQDYGQKTVDIENQIVEKKNALYKKDVENKKQAEQQMMQITAQGFATIAELADAFAGKSEEQQRKAFEIKKKASMAQAVVETIQAAQSAYASQMAITTPDAPVRAAVAAALALAAGVARVRKIEQTPFEAKGLDTAGGGATPPAPTFTPITGGTLPDEQQFGGMGRVYVLEGDITKTQTRVRRLRNTSVV